MIPALVKNKQGHIINISSIAAYGYFPGGAVYCGTKETVKMFSDYHALTQPSRVNINDVYIMPTAQQ